MKKYLKESTKIILTRNTAGNLLTSKTTETTYGEAQAAGQLSTYSGTMIFDFDLAPTEYKNFEGCSTIIRWDGRGYYLPTENIPISQSIYEQGRVVAYDMNGELYADQ